MFSKLMLIIANIVFILFYLQVEPVFLPACLNKAIQITSVSSISATINDQPKVSYVFSMLMYADDTTLYWNLDSSSSKIFFTNELTKYTAWL